MEFTALLPPKALRSFADLHKPAKRTFSIPLYELFDTRQAATLFLLHSAAFPEDVVERINKNTISLNKRLLTQTRFKEQDFIIPEEDVEMTSKEIVDGYFAGTSLQTLFYAQTAFSIPDVLRFEGTWIVAPQGRGKTTLLNNLVMDDLEKVKEGKASVILMDSKGDLIRDLQKLAVFGPNGELAGKLVVIKPDLEHPPAINPMQIKGRSTHLTMELLEYLFGSLAETDMTALQSTLFSSVLTFCLEGLKNPTMADFREVAVNGVAKYPTEYKRIKDPDTRDFFKPKGEFESSTYRETRSQVAWRLRNLRRNPYIRSMFESDRTKIDLDKLLKTNHVIVIDANKSILGDVGAEFFQRFFIALLLASAQSRADWKPSEKMPVYFYIDEAHTAIARDTAVSKIVQECRSQKIAMTFAHQSVTQIRSDEVQAALSDCAIRLANVDEEADFLASKMRTTREYLRSQPKGKFAAFIRYEDNAMTSAVSITVPFVQLDKLPHMSGAEFNDVMSATWKEFCNEPKVEQEPELEEAEPSGD